MQITELASKLEHFGLKEKEAKVYIASLFLGASTAQKIAEQAGVNRATTYVIIEQLIDMGLMSQTEEDKKTIFIAEDPQALDKYIEQQQKSLITKKQDLKALLPELNQINRTSKGNAPTVKFYKGEEGIFNAFNYALRKSRSGSQILGISNYDAAREIYTNRVFKKKPQRLKKKITARQIYSSASDSYPSNKGMLLQTYRIDTHLKAGITIYENFVCFVTYEKNEPVGIMIENPDIAGVMTQLFDLIWQKRSNK